MLTGAANINIPVRGVDLLTSEPCSGRRPHTRGGGGGGGRWEEGGTSPVSFALKELQMPETVKN